jgi:hypothetical protein
MRAIDMLVEERAAGKKPITVDQQQGLIAMLFIEGCKCGLWRDLPETPLDAVKWPDEKQPS